MRKENVFFFSFPSVSNFGGARVTLQGARGAPSGHVLATEKHGLSSFTTWSDESNRVRHEKKRQKKTVFLPPKHRFLGIFLY